MWGGPVAVQSTRTDPHNTDTSTAHTIGILKKLAHQYKSDPFVVQANAEALAPLAAGASQREIASAIFYWVRGRVRFVEDEALLYEQLGVSPYELDKELLIVPPTLLSMPVPMGDCDDFTLLIACQLLYAGIRPYLVTVAADPFDQQKFSHIYVCCRLDDEDGYLCLDAGNRMQAVPPGWESPRVTRKAIWAI